MTTSDLARLIKDRLAALDLSYRAAAARSRGMLTHANLSAIVTGKHGGRLSERTIDGLVLALGVSRSEVERAAGIYRERPAEPFQLPEELNRLNRKERTLLAQMGLALLAAREEGRQEATGGLGVAAVDEAAPELESEDIETVVIERPGGRPFAVARPRALGPMGEHERRQHIARVEQLEAEMQRRDQGKEAP